MSPIAACWFALSPGGFFAGAVLAAHGSRALGRRMRGRQIDDWTRRTAVPRHGVNLHRAYRLQRPAVFRRLGQASSSRDSYLAELGQGICVPPKQLYVKANAFENNQK